MLAVAWVARRPWLAACAAAVASCDDVNVHILSAQQYESTQSCVTSSEAIDVVSGPATSDNCAPTCLTASSADSSHTYVTTVCPPYPPNYTWESQDAETDAADQCPGAFAAYANFLADGATCLAIPDGGADADAAGTEAATDDGSGDMEAAIDLEAGDASPATEAGE
jgi:hypothetical protein